MKKFLFGLLIFVLAVAGSVGINMALVSCDNNVVKPLKPAVGVKEVANCLDSIVNPRLNTTKDVFELQNRLLTNAYIDSIFCSMSQEILENVSTVVIKRLHVVTKDDIVSEYLKNRSVYDNLPPNTTATIESTPPPTTTTKTEEKNLGPVTIVKEGTTTVTEAPQTRVEEQPAGYKDTTINGKKALIQVQ